MGDDATPAEPIRAWRVFRLQTAGFDAPYLRSVSIPVRWFPGTNRARCAGHPDEAGRRVRCTSAPCPPSRQEGRHDCGLYAVRFPEFLRPAALTRGVVAAEVRLWGRVYPHEHGWRAEYGEVISLCLPPSIDRRLVGAADVNRVAARYHVPVIPFPEPLGTPDEAAALARQQAEERRAVERIRAAAQKVDDLITSTRPREAVDGLARLQAARTRHIAPAAPASPAANDRVRQP